MNTAEYNREVNGWTSGTRRKMKNRVLQLVMNAGPSSERLFSKTQKYAGEVNKIGFDFPYYMVFVHKGAGRGYGGNKTGFFTNSSGSKSKTNAASAGRMGTGKRVAKPWFNPIIEENFPVLADLIAIHKGEKIAIKIQRLLID